MTFLAGMILLLSCSLIELQAAVSRISLDGEWDFTFKNKEGADIPELPDTSAYDIQLAVPDYWYFQAARFARAKWWKELGYKSIPHGVFLDGVGFYRKNIKIPADWAKTSSLLVVGKACDRVNIWVNGKHVGYYPFACNLPCRADLSTFLNPGKTNELVIAVSNIKRISSYARLGGIIEPVYLIDSGSEGRINDLFITEGDNLQEAVWKTELKIPFPNMSLPESRLKWEIKSAASSEVIAGGIVKVKPFSGEIREEWKIAADKLKPWSPESPNLYTAELSWEKNDGTLLDRQVRQFGLRKWSYKGKELELNGKPIFLRQRFALGHIPPHYRYPLNKEYWLKYFRMLKEAGYNSLEYGWTLSPNAIEAADEVGLILQVAAGTALSQREVCGKVLKLEDLWKGIAQLTRIHPSVAIICFGGEMNYYDGFLSDVKNISGIVKTVNPRCLILPNHAMRGIDYDFPEKDIPALTDKPFQHHAGRLEEITRYSDIFGHYHSGIFSYNCFSGSWSEYDKDLNIYQRPLIAHEPTCTCWTVAPYPEDGQFNSLRYGKKDVKYLVAMPLWPLERLKKITTQSRQELRHDASSRAYGLCTKYVFEKMRKCGNLAGYEHLSLSFDGMINQYLEWTPGNTARKFRKYNRESVLLLDFDNGNCFNRCYWEGEKFNGKVMISYYGKDAVPKGSLECEIKDANGKILWKKNLETGNLPIGKVTTVSDLDFAWPEVDKNSKLNLSLRFTGSGCDIDNDWDFWVFKHQEPPMVKGCCTFVPYRFLHKRYPGLKYMKGAAADNAEKLWIVEAVSDKEIQHLEEGKDVLLLGASPFPVNTKWTRFQPGYRVQHNNGNVVHRHSVFKDIPNEGWGDWQFYPLIEGAPNILFAKMKGVPFAPILESVGYFENQQAMIFEFKVGKGRLFVASCKLLRQNPVCVTLMDSILEYISGADFKPEHSLPIEYLKGLQAPPETSAKNGEIKFSKNHFNAGNFYSHAGQEGACITSQQAIQAFFELRKGSPLLGAGHIQLAVNGLDCGWQNKPTSVKIFLNGNLVFGGASHWPLKEWGIWTIPLDGKLFQEGKNQLEFSNTDVIKGYNRWVLIREAVIKSTGITANATAAAGSGEEWNRKPVTVTFKTEKWFKVNNGDWKKADHVTISAEGRNKIYAKDSPSDHNIQTMDVNLDVTPPVLGLVSEPVVEQLAGEYYGTPKTVFKVSGTDELSGIRQMEISIDSGKYKPYDGEAFTLSPGRHTLRCRCTDRAGNQNTVFSIGLAGGGANPCLNIQIKE